MKPVSLAMLLALAVTPCVAFADEQPVPLKDAPGHETVENNCAACHSQDYPRTNSPFMDRNGWQAEVEKMIKVFGADIAPQDAATIIEYLAKNYGTGS